MENGPAETKTTCPYCGVGCGVTVTQSSASSDGESSVDPVCGTATHPANFGNLCVKGSALHETLDDTDRLFYPTIRGQRSNWDTALNLIADKINQVIATHGPEAVAFYGAGQMLTEDYYVANKLMKGYIGSANMDTNSRLCMASAVASYKRSLGSDTVPGCYEDLELADLLVLVGSNAAWAHPILFQRMVAAKKNNPDLKVVVIDPRRTATCDLADLHLAIRPGTDTTLFNALLAYLDETGALDLGFIEEHCENFAATLNAASEAVNGFDELAGITDTDSENLQTFFEWFRDIDRTVTFYSQGVNQSSDGTDKANSIINLHLATGRIGKPGASPFSVTGQPNAMGGREVGGLANQLAAHMDFDQADRVKRFWQSPTIATHPGLKAIDLFDEIKAGKVKFLWVISTNPLVSMPDADDVKAALKQCELVVVSDCMANTDTALLGDVLLPASAWGEKNGTVTNSERRISRQRGFLPSPGEARPDWWILSQVGQRMGHKDAFAYQHPSEIFDEHTRLSGFENNGKRDFDLSGLSGMTLEEYDALQPIQWPVNAEWPRGRRRFFEDGHFYTGTGRARFIPVTATLPAEIADGYLLMNTGRVRDHWHTMTRTAKSARLAQHIAEPYADFHPDNAQALGIRDGALVRLFNERGEIVVRANVPSDGSQRHNEIFVPMHWTDRYASLARMGTLIDKQHDPVSGQPALKRAQVQAEPFPVSWKGFVLSRSDLGPVNSDYWVYNRTTTCHMYEVAGNADPAVFASELANQWPEHDVLRFTDRTSNHYRIAQVRDGRLESVIFLHPAADLSARNWLQERFDDEQLEFADRLALLAGRPLGAEADKGAIICSCFQVGEKTIIEAIKNGCDSADALGEALMCGTNCGSCIPELKGLVGKTLSKA